MPSQRGVSTSTSFAASGAPTGAPETGPAGETLHELQHAVTNILSARSQALIPHAYGAGAASKCPPLGADDAYAGVMGYHIFAAMPHLISPPFVRLL